MRGFRRRTGPVLVNQSYTRQRVTGQQRYATEIARRLLADDDCRPLEPTGFWARSTLRVWFWLQFLAPIQARGSVLVSMTARAPLWCRRHVLVVHDLFVLSNPEWFSRVYVATHAWLLRAQIRRAAAIVAVSQPVAEQLATQYDGPVVVAPNAPSSVFDRRLGRPVDGDAADQVLDRFDLRHGRYLLTVGSIDPRKNLRRLAEAFAALPEADRRDCPLVVVGGGSAVFRSEHISWPAEVVDAGFVADEDLRYLYAGCRALVFVSQAEGFGLPLVEAAAAGAPGVVVSDIPVFRWICGDGAIYVDPSSTGSITAGLRCGMAEPRPLEIDLERFSWDVSAEAIGGACNRVRAA